MSRSNVLTVSSLHTLVTIFVLSMATPHLAAATCERQILFLPQSHATEMSTVAATPAQEDQIAHSQLKIADFIERFPHTPVFSENAGYQNFGESDLPVETWRELRRVYQDSVFPKGLPSPTTITPIQRRKLIDNGGDFVQLIRGRLRQINRVVPNKQKSDEIYGPIQAWIATHPPITTPYPPKVATLVYGEREREALKQINQFFKNHPREKTAILIYGANHAVHFYPELFPPECVIVPREFRADWDGASRVGPQGFAHHYGSAYPSTPAYPAAPAPAATSR